MPAAVTVPVPTRLASTYACQDMVEDLPQRTARVRDAAVTAGVHDHPPRPRDQLTPAGSASEEGAASRALVFYGRDS